MNNGCVYKDWVQFFDFPTLHNLLFPATAYTMHGVSFNDNKELHVHLSQPAIRNLQEKGASRQQVSAYMECYGFTHTGYDHYENGRIQFMDLASPRAHVSLPRVCWTVVRLSVVRI